MRPPSRPTLPSAALSLLAALVAVFAVACGSDASLPAAHQDSAATATATGAAGTQGAQATAQPGARRQLGTPTGRQFTQQAPDFVALPGATADFGALGGAVYRIEKPDNWNGQLIMVAHGVRLDSNELRVSNPPDALRQLWVQQGYAWAASSYSENGYVPGIGADDTLSLMDHFTEKYGKPDRVYLYGESMGGHTTALLMEQFPQLFAGGLTVCGAMGGQEQIDYLIAWAMAAEYLGGVHLPDGQGQLKMAQTLSGPLSKALGNPSSLTEAGRAFESVARELSGGPRPFFQEGFAEHYQLNFGLLLVDPNRTSIPGAAATNVDTKYNIEPGFPVDASDLNDGIRRLQADPKARNADTHPDAVPTSGRIKAPLLTLHDTGDVFVPITNEISYAKKADAAGASDLLVQRAIRASGHCNFSAAEVTTAWNDLRGWVEQGQRPAGDDLTGDLSNVGLQFTNPLRAGDPGGK